MKLGRHTREWLPNDTITRNGASRISSKGGSPRKRAPALPAPHDCDVLLIRGNEHADAPSIRSADQHGARVREKSHQHVDGRRCKSTAAFIIALADDQQV